MKKYFYLFILLFVFSSVNTNAQTKIIRKDGFNLYGVIVKESEDSVYLAESFVAIYPIKKKDIYKRYTADVLIEKWDGNKLTGNIINFEKDSITFKNFDGYSTKFSNSEIAKINYYLPNYFFGGITLFTPAGINVHVGKYFSSHFGSSFQVGYCMGLGVKSAQELGAQANLLYRIQSNKFMDQNIGACFGLEKYNKQTQYSHIDDRYFAGIFYDINFYGVYLQVGESFGLGSGNRENSPLFQIGYVFRFNH